MRGWVVVAVVVGTKLAFFIRIERKNESQVLDRHVGTKIICWIIHGDTYSSHRMQILVFTSMVIKSHPGLPSLTSISAENDPEDVVLCATVIVESKFKALKAHRVRPAAGPVHV